MRKRTNSDSLSNFLTKEQTALRFNIGTSSVDKIALKARAKLKIGKCARYDVEAIENYLREQCVSE